MIGYLELVSDELVGLSGDTARIAQMQDVMARNGQVLLARIDQLLSASPSEAVTAQRVNADVVHITQAALSKHRVLADGAGLQLHLDAPTALFASVDRLMLEQIVDDLVSNAVKYTRHGSISVSIRPENNIGPTAQAALPTPTAYARRAFDEPLDGSAGFCIVVADTGIGMDENDRRNALRRFYRAESSTAQAIPGIGLGLAITHHLIRLHNGTIDLTSRPGVGTTVTVHIPSQE